MKKEKKAVLIYSSWQTLFKGLTDEQAGELIKAICSYQDDPDYMPPSPVVAAMFSMIKERMDADAEAYEETCRRRSESARNAAAVRWHADDAERMRPHAEGMRSGAENADAKAKADADTKAEPSDEGEDARARATTPTTSARAFPEAPAREREPGAAEDAAEGGAAFFLHDGQEYRPPDARIRAWKKAFPKLDVDGQLLRCAVKYHTLDPMLRRNRITIEQYIVTFLQIADGEREKAERGAKSGSGGQSRERKGRGGFLDVPQRDAVPERELWAALEARGSLV